MSIANLLVPNNLAIYCGSLNVNGIPFISSLTVQSNLLTGLATPAPFTAYFTQVGNIVTMVIPTTVSGTGAATAQTLSFGNPIPTPYLPSSTVTSVIQVIDSTLAATVFGFFTLTESGSVTISTMVCAAAGAPVVAGTFGIGGTNGILSIAVSWPIISP
jgi:hypothetical protein